MRVARVFPRLGVTSDILGHSFAAIFWSVTAPDSRGVYRAGRHRGDAGKIDQPASLAILRRSDQCSAITVRVRATTTRGSKVREVLRSLVFRLPIDIVLREDVTDGLAKFG